MIGHLTYKQTILSLMVPNLNVYFTTSAIQVLSLGHDSLEKQPLFLLLFSLKVISVVTTCTSFVELFIRAFLNTFFERRHQEIAAAMCIYQVYL